MRGKAHGIDCKVAHHRYGPLHGFESLCERVRGYGSSRAWIGGGPLDRCGLASAHKYPAAGVNYAYLTHVAQPAIYAAPSAVGAGAAISTVGADQPAGFREESAPVFAPDANRNSELLPLLGNDKDEA